MRLVLALLGVAALAACGPIQSTAALMDADVELEAARTAGAPKTSVYEFTGAEAYLHKAREQSGRSDYDASTRYAQRALALAKEARKNAQAAANKLPELP